MWYRKKSKLLGNILLLVLVIGLSVGILKGFLYMRNQQKIQDEALVAAAVKANEESQKTSEISNETLEAEYRKDLDTVARYMPGIVCWGDVLTEGTAGGISYPKTLQKLIKERITDQYNFKATIDNYYDYTRVEWEDYTVEIPVVNMGTGEESSYTVLGRSGVVPYVVSDSITIPADCTKVELPIQSSSGKKVKPLINGDGGINPVTINGIEGTISVDPSSYSEYANGKYYFTRSAPGQATEILEGTKIVTNVSSLYKDYISVIFIGTYGEWRDAEDLVSQQKKLIERQTANTDRYIVLGVYNAASGGSSFYSQLNAMMSQEYGDRFINLRKYLLNDAMGDLGMQLTTKDSALISTNRIPSSLLSSASDTELIAAAYEKIGELIFERMDSLGYFDEIREELEILPWDEIQKQEAGIAQQGTGT